MTDFRFSPGGSFIAFRAGDALGGEGLHVVDLRTTDKLAVPVPVDGSVTSYTWGPAGATGEASHLAFAYQEESGSFVTALRLGLESGGEGALGAAEILGALAIDIQSEIVWTGADLLAFLAPQPPSPDAVLTTVAVSQTAVGGTDQRIVPIIGEATLRPVPKGVFVETAFARFYFPNAPDSVAVHALDRVLAPSGEYVGNATQGVLEIWRSEDRSAAPHVRSSQRCDRLLDWGAANEQIACANDDDELVFFELDPTGPTLTGRSVLAPSARYQWGDETGRWRSFSTNGDFFALSAATSVLVFRLTGTEPTLTTAFSELTLDVEATGPISFSPNGHIAAVPTADGVHFASPDGSSTSSYWLTDANETPLIPCSEQADSPALPFCGGSSVSQLRWSADGNGLAYPTTTAQLLLLEFGSLTSSANILIGKESLDVSCTGCIAPGSYAFQP